MSQLDDHSDASRGAAQARSEMAPEVLDAALHELEAEVVALLAVEDRAERKNALAVLVQRRRPVLVELMRCRPLELDLYFVRMSAASGLQADVDRVRKHLRTAAQAAALGMTVVDASTPVASQFAFVFDKKKRVLEVPEGWGCNDAGVSELKRTPEGTVTARRMAHAPIVILGTRSELGASTAWVELAWPRNGAWSVHRVSRGVVTSARELTALGKNAGSPINSENAGAMVRWLASLEAANPDLDRGYASTHMGWQGKGTSHFLAGPVLYAPAEKRKEIALLTEDDPGLSKLAKACTPKGTMEGWLEVLGHVESSPVAWVAIYAAAAAPLLRVLDAPNFILDVHGSSGHGKTSVLRLAASVWGEPSDGRYLRSWQATVSSIERDAAALTDLPLCLDESNRVPLKDRPQIASALYMLANGSGKGRASIKGTQQVAEWRTVVLSTGEASITSYSEDEGARARCLPLYGSPLRSAEDAESIRWGTQQHYGHLGPALVHRLVQMTDDERTALRAGYDARVTQLGQAATSPMARRVCVYVAVLQVAAELLHGDLGIPRPEVDVWRFLAAQVGGGVAAADRPAAALRGLALWALAQPGRLATWGGRRSSEQDVRPLHPAGGAEWIGRVERHERWTWLALSQGAVTSWLKRENHEPTAVLRAWADRGWLVKGQTNLGTPTSMPGTIERVRMYRLTREALDLVGATSRADEGDDE